MRPAASSTWTLPLTSGEALGLLVAPLAAALVCALPVAIAGSAVGAACVFALYVVVLGITPNFALGRRALFWARSRRRLTLGVSVIGGVLVKVAVVLLLTVIGPPLVLAFDRQGRLLGRWMEMAVVGAWALPIAAVLGAVEGAVFWSVARRWDRRAAAPVAGRS